MKMTDCLPISSNAGLSVRMHQQLNWDINQNDGMWKVLLAESQYWGVFLRPGKSLCLFFMLVLATFWVLEIAHMAMGEVDVVAQQRQTWIFVVSKRWLLSRYTYIRHQKCEALLCFKSQENTLYTILFDESGLYKSLLLSRLLESWLSTASHCISIRPPCFWSRKLNYWKENI